MTPETMISPAAARHLIQRMGEIGQPPERGALAVNTGTNDILDVLRREYLEPIVQSGRNSSFKLVQAPFGGGKTQFLHCLRETGWKLGLLSSLVGVSPKDCPFDDPVKIYREVARNLELPPEDFDEAPESGIDVVLREVTRRRVEELGEPAVRAWIRDELSDARIENRSFRRAIVLYMSAVLDRDDEREEILAAWLAGDEVSTKERTQLRLRDQLSDSNAFQFLRSLVQAIRALALPGVILLFDEMDRVMSLTARRKKSIGDNLRQMIDRCGQSSLPGMLWVYAVPPEFMTNVVPEYPALEQRLKGATRFSNTSPLQPIIDLDHLPIPTEQLFFDIGWRLLELYEHGFEYGFDHGIQRENIRSLARAASENELETGLRRTFVKSAVDLLGQQHRAGESRLDDAAIRKITTTHRMDDLTDLEGEVEIF